MQRTELPYSNVKEFLANNKTYADMKAYIKTANHLIDKQLQDYDDALIMQIERGTCFKDVYVTAIQKLRYSELITPEVKPAQLSKEQIMHGLNTLSKEFPFIKTILYLTELGEEMKPYYDAEIALEKQSVQAYLANNHIIIEMDKLEMSAHHDVKDKISHTIHQIKQADTFDELLTITESVKSAKPSTWIKANIFGGISGFNHQLRLLRDDIMHAQKHFQDDTHHPTIAQPKL